jgi:hypothetical protein
MEHVEEMIQDLDEQINTAWSEVVDPGDKVSLRITLGISHDKDDSTMLDVEAKVDIGRVRVGAKSAFHVSGAQIPLPLQKAAARSLEQLRPRPGSGCESVSLTSDGVGVTLHSDGRTEAVG